MRERSGQPLSVSLSGPPHRDLAVGRGSRLGAWPLRLVHFRQPNADFPHRQPHIRLHVRTIRQLSAPGVHCPALRNGESTASPQADLEHGAHPLVVRWDLESKERHLDVLRWGLVPYLTKDLKTARKPINAGWRAWRHRVCSRRLLATAAVWCPRLRITSGRPRRESATRRRPPGR